MALVQDTFTRANTTASTTIMGTGVGWGSAASDGNTWTKGGTATPNFQIAGNQGKITNTNANVFCLLSATSYGNVNGLVRVSTNSTNAANFQGLIARYTSGANSYRCFLVGGNTLQINKGTTSLGTFSFTWSANTEYWIRFQVLGSTLTAKVWADGSSEPTSWQITVTDATLTSGQVGIYSSPDVAATTASFDSFSVNYATATKTLQSRVLLAVQNTKTLVTRFLLRVQNTKTLQVRTRLSVQVTKTLQARLRLSTGNIVTKWLQARVRLAVQATKTLQARLRLAVQQTKTLQVRSLMSVQSTKTLQTRTRLSIKGTKTLQVRFGLALPVAPAGYITGTIGSQSVLIYEGTYQLDDSISSVSTLMANIRDDSGLNHYTKGQPISTTDSVHGLQYTGFVSTAVEDRHSPATLIETRLGARDNHYLAEKRTYDGAEFTNVPAGAIVCQLMNTLSQEGITANYAAERDTTATDFSAGTLTNVVGASNVGDGDLELALAGTSVTISESTTAQFSSGTLTNVVASGNTLAPVATSAIKLVATCSQPGSNNAYTYMKIWTGNHAVGANENFSYDIFVLPSSPTGQMAVDVLFTDGTNWRDTALIPDAQYVFPHPTNDVGPMGVGQWYHRSFYWGQYSGKTIQSVQVVSEGNTVGVYTGYFKNIQLNTSFFTFTSNTVQQIANNGYSSSIVSTVNTYDLIQNISYGTQTFRNGTSYSIDAAKILQSSNVTWSAVEPAGTKFVLKVSYDGGLTFWPCTKNAPLPNLPPGSNIAGKTLIFSEQFWYDTTLTGSARPGPEAAPVLSLLQVTLQPSYSATKTDIVYEVAQNSDWALGTFANTSNNGGIDLTLLQSTRNWNDGNAANQTLYSASAATSPDRQAFHINVPAASGGVNAEARSRMDFAGTVADGTVEVDIVLDQATPILSLIYRTTNWENHDLSWGYAVEVTQTTMKLFKGPNSSTYGATQIGSTVTLNVSSGNSHRIKAVFVGNSHKIYFDDVLYINQTDGTYSTGKIALRVSNGTASAYTAFFDNFGVISAGASLTGQWVSPSQNIASVGTYGTSVVSWRDMSSDPGNTNTLLVETSVDNGASYQTATNGSPLPNLTAGQSLTGVKVKVRITLTTTTASTSPSIDNIVVRVMSQLNATGTRISPALSLAHVGKLGGSVISWNNVILPTGCTLGVDARVDAGSWVDITASNGSPIPGLTAQAPVVLDMFAIDSHANYTNASMLGNTLLYGSSVADVLLTTACDLATTTGGIETSVAITLAGGTGNVYGELPSQGGAGTCASSIPATPTGSGWVFKPGAGTFAAGNWSASIAINYANVIGSNSTTTVRFLKLAGGLLSASTLIGTITVASGSGGRVAYSFAPTSMSSVIFGSSDLLYCDLWLHDNQLNVSGDNPTIYLSSSSSQGVAGDMQITAPSFAVAWTWDTANSRLIGTGGTNQVLEYSGLSFSDGYVECDMDYANVAGPVLRMVSATQCYFLKISDDQGTNPQTVQLFKNNGGAAQIGATVPISFVRGTYHRVHFEMVGSQIIVKFDGAQIISATDSSIAGPGLAGLFQNNYGRFYSIRIQPAGQDVTSHTVQTRLRLASTNPLATPQVTDISVAAFGLTIQAGVNIPQTTMFHKYCDACMDDLANASDYWWNIDKNKVLYFLPQNAMPAPWIASDGGTVPTSGDFLDANITVEDASDLYFNREIVDNVLAPITINQNFIGDGVKTTWTCSNQWAGAPVVTVTNLVTGAASQATVGILNVDTGKQFYYSVGSQTITEDTSGPVYDSTFKLNFTGPGQYLTYSQYDNTTAQAARAAIEGVGTGIVVRVVDGTGLTKAQGDTLAQADVTRYSVIGRLLKATTRRYGLQKGQAVSLFLPAHNIWNQLFLIRRVQTRLTTEYPNGTAGGSVQQGWYDIEAISGPDVGDWTKLYSRPKNKPPL